MVYRAKPNGLPACGAAVCDTVATIKPLFSALSQISQHLKFEVFMNHETTESNQKSHLRTLAAALVMVLIVAGVVFGRSWFRDTRETRAETGQRNSGKPAGELRGPASPTVDPGLSDKINNADLSVLFIGNSHTANPGIAQIIETMLRSKHPNMKLCLVSQTYGSTPLTVHAKDKLTLETIAAGPWDYIVLQGSRHSSTEKGAREISRLESISPETKILLYSVWGTKQKPADAESIYQSLCKTGESINAGVVPVGLAWLDCSSRHPEMPLYASDGNHSTIVGGYLTSCVFYSYLMQKPCMRMGELKNISKKQQEMLNPGVRVALERFAFQAWQRHAVYAAE